MKKDSAQYQACEAMARAAGGQAAHIELCALSTSNMLKKAIRAIESLPSRPDAGAIAEQLRRVGDLIAPVPELAEHAEHLSKTFRDGLNDLERRIQTVLPQADESSPAPK